MSSDRQREVGDFYKQARNILLHAMTEDEQAFVNELAIDNHATLPDAKLFRLKEQVRTKCHKQAERS
jgi:hypothetical protein